LRLEHIRTGTDQNRSLNASETGDSSCHCRRVPTRWHAACVRHLWQCTVLGLPAELGAARTEAPGIALHSPFSNWSSPKTSTVTWSLALLLYADGCAGLLYLSTSYKRDTNAVGSLGTRPPTMVAFVALANADAVRCCGIRRGDDAVMQERGHCRRSSARRLTVHCWVSSSTVTIQC
jgi:hypothetical protein